jgi:hypothetical protein
MATTSRLNLTRDQLATFLKDHEQIRQFERLFALVDTIAPDVVSEVSTAAGIAQATAVQAVGMALQFAQDAAVCCAAAEAKAQEALERLAALERDSAVNGAEAKAQVALDQIAALQADLGPSAAELQTLLAALRTEVEGLQMTPPPVPKRRTRYGQFYDTTTQTALLASTAYAITFNTTDISNGVRLRSPSTSEIEVDTEGLYNFQASIQLDCTGGSNREVWVWVRKNGTDIPNSAFYVTIQNNNSELLQAFNLFVDMKTGDYVQFMWAVGNTAARLETFAASAFAPAVPSIILTVSNNIRGEL